MNKLYLKAAGRFLQLPIIVGLLIFLPAGTLDFWQAWLLTAVFFICSLAITVYLAISDPPLLERRMRAGPGAETETAQKIIVALMILCLAAMLVLSALDHRFGWSDVPNAAVIFGNLLIIVSFCVFYLVLRENTYSAATVQIAEGQTVISTGPYAIVRHPMYSAALIMALGISPALGSWWGLAFFVPALAGFVWRLLDEERFLSRNLAGYVGYMKRVRYRLVPLVW